MRSLGRGRGLGGIPRVTLQGRGVTQGTDSRGRPTARTYTPFDLLSCTVQPYIGDDLLTLEDGYSNKNVLKIWTETKCVTTKEGSAELADEVYFDGDWYKVKKSQPWQNGVISHYELTVVQIDEVLNG